MKMKWFARKSREEKGERETNDLNFYYWSLLHSPPQT
jgi:hypothetical protein